MTEEQATPDYRLKIISTLVQAGLGVLQFCLLAAVIWFGLNYIKEVELERIKVQHERTEVDKQRIEAMRDFSAALERVAEVTGQTAKILERIESRD